ncbi:hypothetical protein K466DRAFT_607483 [Polyporus arcularius HHB13444]|uniref:CCHC-type domain-containing protein n=1 Tax=Polyporus arcularius HHB13444 TaxID=1314778 RepID=A0A5C3NPR8_9APHY|nr:hypothetical protein K466DRAFT_607483 [Polyporus arcularius HHB13444]
MTTPFDVDNLTAIVETMFGRNRFDAGDSDSEGDNGSDEDTSFETTEDEESDDNHDSDSDHQTKPSRHEEKKTPKKSSKVKDKAKHKEKSDPLPPKQTDAQPSRDTSEVEDIIRRLQNMSIDDPAYAALYFRGFKLDKDIVQVIRGPKEAVKPSYTAPPIFSQNSGIRPLGCYGCGEQGHGMNFCPKINELVTKGILKRDNNNKLTFADGSLIQRQRDETFVHAAQ